MIDTKAFFRIGVISFTVIGLMSTINFFIFYANGNVFSHIGSAFGIFFNFVTAAFFYYLLKTQGGVDTGIGSDSKAIEEALKEFNNNGKPKRRKPGV